MEHDYVICMDSSGDIDRDVVRDNEILFVPMEYTVGEEVRTSGGCEEESLMKQFYDAQRNNIETRTSQIAPYTYTEFFRRYLEQGQSVLYFCLSSGLSSTYDCSRAAVAQLKEEFPEQDVISIDTLAATGGIGILVEKAAENRKSGMTLAENYENIQSLIPHLHHYFLVQDLIYLMRGGRLNAASAYLGSMLNIRPVLKIDEEGKLATIDKKRGNKAAVQRLLEYFDADYDPAYGSLVYMCDADVPELSEGMKTKLLEKYPDLNIRHTMLCPVIGAHTGPGMASVIFLGK